MPFALTTSEENALRTSELAEDAINIGTEIGLSTDTIQSISQFNTPWEVSQYATLTTKLFEPEHWNDTVAELTLRVNDPSGMALLACFLRASCLTRRRYASAGISDNLFLSTMRFFPRFIEQYRSAHGIERFDQEFWAPRLITMSIFRIGELEFEFMDNPVRQVGIHIPADAKLNAEALAYTLREYATFIHAHYRYFEHIPPHCESWLLDPTLEEMLTQKSRIRIFRSLFHVKGLQYSDDYKRWICGRHDVPDADLPENTSLQRSIKRFVSAGGRMGIGYGVMYEDTFSKLWDIQ